MTTSKPEFYGILTETGRALQFECLHSEKEFTMTEMAVGDGNGSSYEPERTQTKLKNECYRHSVTRYLTDEKGLVKSVILDIPEQVSGFTIREAGVYGENGELLIIVKYPPTPKLASESGAPSQHAIKINLAQINELVLPVLIDPSVNTASVQYVEEHFQALAEKGVAGGYAPLDASAKVPQEMVQKQLTPFCFNAGLVDAAGKAACVTLNGNTLTLLEGSVGTSAEGTTYTVAADVSIDISGLAEGTYNLFYDAEEGVLEAYANTIFVSEVEPEMAINDVWVDASILPYSSKMKNSSGELESREIIPLPAKLDITSVSVGGGRAILMPENYNNNGLKQENFVHLDGNEEIAGIKTFLQSILTPTPSSEDNSTKAATTAFVKTLLAAYAKLASPAFSGTPTAPTPASNDNSTKLATTAFVNTLINSKVASGLYYSIGGNYLELFTSPAKNSRVLLIQWGVYTAANNSEYTITLPRAFSTTNYAPVAIDTSDGSGNSHCSVTGRTTTNFSGRHSKEKYPICWIAIGK